LESLSAANASDPVGARLRDVDLNIIVGGKNRLGHKQRRMKIIMDALLQDKCDATRADSDKDAQRYKARLVSAAFAEKASDELWILSASVEELTAVVKDLESNGVSWTSFNKECFMKKRLHGYGLSIFEQPVVLDSFLVVVTAWTAAVEGFPKLEKVSGPEMDALLATTVTQDELLEFKPLRATMVQLDGSMKDKAVMTQKFLYSYLFQPLCCNVDKIGAADSTKALTTVSQHFVDTPLDIDDALAESAYSIVLATRFTRHLLDPLDVVFASDFQELRGRCSP
jgi:hypothetical protein